jgi:hypothetical protein
MLIPSETITQPKQFLAVEVFKFLQWSVFKKGAFQRERKNSTRSKNISFLSNIYRVDYTYHVGNVLTYVGKM